MAAVIKSVLHTEIRDIPAFIASVCCIYCFSLLLMTDGAIAASIEEVEANDSIAQAQNVDASFSLAFNPDIVNPEAWPWVSVSATGNGTYDYYSFTVPAGGVTGFFDIDYAAGGAAESSFDSELFIYDESGLLLADNDDSSTVMGAAGSVSTQDSFRQYQFLQPGVYVVAVGEFNSFGNAGGLSGNTPDPGHTYTLQISLTEHAGGTGSDSDGDGVADSEDCHPNSDLNPTINLESCDTGVENTVYEDGCSLADLVLACADDYINHGDFVSCASEVANGMQREGLISGVEKGAIQRCAARTYKM